jgi:hypothetical protein
MPYVGAETARALGDTRTFVVELAAFSAYTMKIN